MNMPIFHHRKFSSGLTTSRIEAFSDGVFSIAITLLVLSIAVPELSSQELAAGALLPHVLALWSKILSYMISFALIGTFWLGHHIMFHYIKRSDRLFALLNLLFLMLIAFFPFPAALLGQYGTDRTAALVYGGTLVLLGFAFELMWFWASHGHRLIEKDAPPRLIRLASKVLLAAPLTYLLAVLPVFIDPRLSFIIYVLVPIAYMVPSPIDELIDYRLKSDV